MVNALPPPMSHAHGDADGVLGVCSAAQAEEAAAEEQVRQRTKRNRRARLREATQLVIGEPDPVARCELRSQQSVFLVDLRVVVATGEVVVRCANLGRVLGDVRVDPAVIVLLLQLPAAVHHFPGAAHSEAWRDGVEIAALAVVALDQTLGLAVEFIRRDEDLGRRETVDSGQAGDHAHVAPSRLVEELLRRDRAAGGERQACCRAPGQQGVEEIPGSGARVVAVAVLQFFRKDPGLQPIKQLVAVRPEDPNLRKVNVPVDEPREDQPVLQMGNRKVGVARRDVGECAKILDNPVLDDEQPVADETGSVLLVSDVLPRVVDEVEESSSDRATGTGHDDSSSQKLVTLRSATLCDRDGYWTTGRSPALTHWCRTPGRYEQR